MSSILQKINKKIFLTLVALLSVLIIGVALFIVYDAFAIREAVESGLPKRNPIQFVFEETQNLVSKTLFGKPTESSQKRAESRKETLKKFGKFTDLSSEAKKTKKGVISSSISANRGDYLLKKTDNFQIEYIEFPDQFFATIVTEPVEKYQKETEQWFLDQGFTPEDLCGLGIKFIVSRDLELKVGYEINEFISYCK